MAESAYGRNVDLKLVEALKLDNESWKIGDPDAVIHTKSGSRYCVASDGAITGGLHIEPDRPAELWGAVYRRCGPMRMNQIVVGLAMEISRSERSVLITSPVVKIEVQG